MTTYPRHASIVFCIGALAIGLAGCIADEWDADADLEKREISEQESSDRDLSIDDPSTISSATEVVGPISFLHLSGSSGSWRDFYVDVPFGTAALTAQLGGGINSFGDADLYVRRSALPTTGTFDCRPFLVGNNEQCRIFVPAADRYFISIHGFSSYGDVTLSIFW